MREETKSLVAKMLSSDPKRRQDALATLQSSDVSILPELAELAASSDKPTAKAATLAMERLVHAQLAPKNGKPDRKRQMATADSLFKIATESKNATVAASALELLGFAGDESHAKKLEAVGGRAQMMASNQMAVARIRSNRY